MSMREMFPAGRTLPPTVAASVDADYREALGKLEKAVEAIDAHDLAEAEPPVLLPMVTELAETARRVLRLAGMRP